MSLYLLDPHFCAMCAECMNLVQRSMTGLLPGQCMLAFSVSATLCWTSYGHGMQRVHILLVEYLVRASGIVICVGLAYTCIGILYLYRAIPTIPVYGCIGCISTVCPADIHAGSPVARLVFRIQEYQCC